MVPRCTFGEIEQGAVQTPEKNRAAPIWSFICRMFTPPTSLQKLEKLAALANARHATCRRGYGLYVRAATKTT